MSAGETLERPRRSAAVWILVVVVSLVLPAAVIFGGLRVAAWMMATGPEAKKKKPKRKARLVEVVSVAAGDVNTRVHAMGTVRSARQVVLRARVAGEVVSVSSRFLPGGRFAAGDPILEIDPRDYELAVERRESELATARADLELEKGNQEIARREFELLGQEIAEEDRALVLREPQLAKVRARVRLAETALAEAKLALSRTKIRAPFSCMVRDRGVDVGAQVGTATALATLLDADELWVEVSVPVEQLGWIELPEEAGRPGGPATVLDAGGGEHPGHVIGLTGELEPEGRMARLLVSVREPPKMDGTGLIVGSYVHVRIDGRKLEGVLSVPSRLVRDGDSLWIMTDDGTLEIRPIAIVFRERDHVYVEAGLRPGERIVTSDLAAPAPGMPLRLNGDDEAPIRESAR